MKRTEKLFGAVMKASWDGIKTCLSWNPLTTGSRWPLTPPLTTTTTTTKPAWTRSDGKDGGRPSTLMAYSDDFRHTHTHTHTHKCPHSSSLLLPPPHGPGPCRQHTHTHTHLLPHTHTHTHTHTMVRPPIKSKVVCFYWSFALTSGLSFWRLYLSVSSWKPSVDNAQCFQLEENQTPAALAIFPAPPHSIPTSPAHLPSLPPSFLLHSLHDPPLPYSPLSLSLSSVIPPSLPPPVFSPGEGGLSLLQITDTKRRWWRRWRWELPVQGPVSINETMKVHFARMHVLNSFLCDSWLGNVSVNLIKDSAGSHYFLSTPVPDGVKVHHLHPWLVRGAAAAPEQEPLSLSLFYKCCLFVERSRLFTYIPPRKTRFTPCSKTIEVPKFIQRRHTFLQNKSRRIFNTTLQMGE